MRNILQAEEKEKLSLVLTIGQYQRWVGMNTFRLKPTLELDTSAESKEKLRLQVLEKRKLEKEALRATDAQMDSVRSINRRYNKRLYKIGEVLKSDTTTLANKWELYANYLMTSEERQKKLKEALTVAQYQKWLELDSVSR